MKLNENFAVFSILGAVILAVSLLVVGFYFPVDFQNPEPKSKTPEYYMSLGSEYSVEELLSDPSLIKIRKTSDNSITLQSDGVGREYGCASLSVERFSQDDLDEYVQRGEIPRKFLNITDDDLVHVPQLKELIAATHQIEIPYNDSVRVYFDGIDFVEYEFFLADKMIEKYGGTRDDYFMRLNSDYEERLTNPKKQGFSNEFDAPRIIYDGNVYAISGTVFWTSDEHNLSMSLHLRGDDDGHKTVTLTDDDMEKVPKFKEAIGKIGLKQESVRSHKSLPEPEWNYYRQWYAEKSESLESAYEDRIRVSGFVYGDEHYSVSFGIC